MRQPPVAPPLVGGAACGWRGLWVACVGTVESLWVACVGTVETSWAACVDTVESLWVACPDTVESLWVACVDTVESCAGDEPRRYMTCRPGELEP